MRSWERISSQFGKPTGFLGSMAGYIMAQRRSNRERNNWAVSLLTLQPSDSVLEIGFGPGIAIRRMSEIVTEGAIWGVDHSEVMVRQASQRNGRAISTGRVRLILGSVSDMASLVAPIDKVLAVNSFQFWKSPEETLTLLRASMTPGGLIALVHQPRKPGATDHDADRVGRDMATWLEKAGFGRIAIEKKPMKPVSTVCALGMN